MTRHHPVAGAAALLAFALSVPAQQAATLHTPLLFEANAGQFAAAARFVAKGAGWRQFFSDDAVVLVLDAPERDRCVALFTRFVGARAGEPVGLEPAVTRLHYLRGPTPHTDVPTFQQLRYRELWPGVDLLYQGEQGRLRYDFELAPGVDPALVRLRFEGVLRIALADDGSLLLETALGQVRHSPPVLYQPDGGGRKPVDGRFVLHGDEVGFAVGERDPALPLVIDPVLGWATYLGGTGIDRLLDIAADAAGNVHATGTSFSTDLPTAAGVFQPARGGRNDAFAAKVDASGGTLLWCTYLGGAVAAGGGFTAVTEAAGIAVLADGSVVLAGRTSTSDFPTTAGALQPAITAVSDSVDAFLTRLAADGRSLVWSTFFGGSSNHDSLRAVAVGPGEDLFVAGFTGGGSAFPTTAGAHQRTGNSVVSAVVARFTASGALVWSTYLSAPAPAPASADDRCYAIDVDHSGRVYVAGLTHSTNWQMPNGFQPAYGGGYSDLFVARLRADGSALDYGSLLGGSDLEGTWNFAGIAAHDDGRCWVVGSTLSTDFPVSAGAAQTQYHGNGDATVTCVDTTATGAASLLWSTYFGGSRLDRFCGAVVDAQGECVVSGSTQSANYPLAHAWQPCRGGSEDYALAAFDAGGGLQWSTYLGGGGQELGTETLGSLATDGSGHLFVGGSTASVDFATAGAAQTVLPGAAAAGCIARLDPQPTPTASAAVRAACSGSNLGNGLLPIDPRPSLGSTFRVGIDDAGNVAGLPPGCLSFWVLSLTRNAQHPCGVPIPGTGLGGAAGEALVDVGNLFVGSVQVWPGPGTPAVHRVTIPCHPLLHGVAVHTQGAFLSPSAQVVLTNALDLTAGW